MNAERIISLQVVEIKTQAFVFTDLIYSFTSAIEPILHQTVAQKIFVVCKLTLGTVHACMFVNYNYNGAKFHLIMTEQCWKNGNIYHCRSEKTVYLLLFFLTIDIPQGLIKMQTFSSLRPNGNA
jgi:hypothetical protein